MAATPIKGQRTNTLEKAGQFLGTAWEVLACRPPKRGELVYNACYDRIGPAPDGGIMCAVIVELLPGWEESFSA